MIRIRISKHKAIVKVMKDTSKEVQALINKVTRRSTERRVLRTQLETSIANYISNNLDTSRVEVLGGEKVSHTGPKESLISLRSSISALIAPYYEGDNLQDDPKLYAEELEAFINVLTVAIEVVAKSDATDVDQMLQDTKTLCGYIENNWGGQGALVLLGKTDLGEFESHELHCEGMVSSLTCGDYVKLEEEWEKYCKDGHRKPEANAPEQRVPHGVFWYCKDDNKFFNTADITAKENAKKSIRAFVERSDDNRSDRW